MAMSIVSNAVSLRAQSNLSKTQANMAGSIQKLSSGLRINSASDDAAGLSISTNLSAQTRGLKQAERNSNDAISLVQTAEGAMGEVHGILDRMRELAVQASNEGTLSSTDRGYIDDEFQQLEAELNRITDVTEYNGQALVNGGSAAAGQDASLSFSFQVGMNNTANDRISLTVKNVDSSALRLQSTSLATAGGAQTAISSLDQAIQSVTDQRGSLGVMQNRLTMTVSNLQNMHENLSSANSRIKDVDVASESAAMTSNQIKSQAGIAMLAQANQLPSAALSLIG